MEALENIDDDCDRNGIILVKLDNPLEAKEYGIDAIPSLVYFEVRNPQCENFRFYVKILLADLRKSKVAIL